MQGATITGTRTVASGNSKGRDQPLQTRCPFDGTIITPAPGGPKGTVSLGFPDCHTDGVVRCFGRGTRKHLSGPFLNVHDCNIHVNLSYNEQGSPQKTHCRACSYSPNHNIGWSCPPWAPTTSLRFCDLLPIGVPEIFRSMVGTIPGSLCRRGWIDSLDYVSYILSQTGSVFVNRRFEVMARKMGIRSFGALWMFSWSRVHNLTATVVRVRHEGC